MIKFLIGGSPCTNWSIAKRNRETKPEGVGWELFKNYLIAREKFQPDFFLYENNQSTAPAIKEQIAAKLGTPLQYINSALVSAQQRKRFYCHNFGDVPLPEDRGIVLQDILQDNEGGREKTYAIRTDVYSKMTSESIAHREKACTLRASGGMKQGKCNLIKHITSNGQFGYMGVPVRIGTIERNNGKNSQGYRVYAPHGKSTCLTAEGSGGGVEKLGFIPYPSAQARLKALGCARITTANNTGFIPRKEKRQPYAEKAAELELKRGFTPARSNRCYTMTLTSSRTDKWKSKESVTRSNCWTARILSEN
jgi:DNA (cytosine-5)-methyltransferase 3A